MTRFGLPIEWLGQANASRIATVSRSFCSQSPLSFDCELPNLQVIIDRQQSKLMRISARPQAGHLILHDQLQCSDQSSAYRAGSGDFETDPAWPLNHGVSHRHGNLTTSHSLS